MWNLIDVLFGGTSPPVVCASYPSGRKSDYNGDSWMDVQDMGWLIDYIYAGGAVPLDPCA